MIRFIAALDQKRGIANDHGIPWQGKVPTDVKYYHEKASHGILVMGYGLYKELSKPLKNDHDINYVATRDKDIELKPGFKVVSDARAFIEAQTEDVWNLGGAMLFESTMDLADEVYLTQLDSDFKCTKFFPEYEKDFNLVTRSEPITENGITFCFEIWQRKEPQS